MSDIAIITIRERNARTGVMEEVVDRAFDLRTERAVVLPIETPQALGARWNDMLGLWVIPEGTPATDPRGRFN